MSTATLGECRMTDPVTGGQKGIKITRHDLIPAHELYLVLDALEGAGHEERLAALLRWKRRATPPSIHPFPLIAAFCIDALGAKWEYYLARVYGMGAAKYDDDNWRKGYKWSWSYGALRRHLEDHNNGEWLNFEADSPCEPLPHLAHALWHCLTLIHFITYNIGTDDRWPLKLDSTQPAS